MWQDRRPRSIGVRRAWGCHCHELQLPSRDRCPEQVLAQPPQQAVYCKQMLAQRLLVTYARMRLISFKLLWMACVLHAERAHCTTSSHVALAASTDAQLQDKVIRLLLEPLRLLRCVVLGMVKVEHNRRAR